MLENNSNLFNRPFGLNVHVPTRTLQQVQDTAVKAVSGLWEPVVDFFETADDVIDGTVQEEINKCNRFAYSLGVTMRQGQERHSFNMKG
ncbi:hypothetical protein IJG14_01350 [bacterium]|nr:hypothetical protein [bacterium]